MNQTLKIIIIIYLCIINLAGFVLMGSDKNRARRKAWRVPEKTFFIVSLLGGSLGTWAGMYAYRHKTMHWYFVVFIPLILVAQIALVVYLVAKGIIF